MYVFFKKGALCMKSEVSKQFKILVVAKYAKLCPNLSLLTSSYPSDISVIFLKSKFKYRFQKSLHSRCTSPEILNTSSQKLVSLRISYFSKGAHLYLPTLNLPS